MRLASKYPVHLVCFARSAAEIDAARHLSAQCASVYVEVLPTLPQLARALPRFALGQSLTTSFYDSPRMRRHIRRLRPEAVVAYCSAMGVYSPPELPLVCDMVDVDSEKWSQYSATRFPAGFYRRESDRVRQLEIRVGKRATKSFFSTRQELRLFGSFAPDVPAAYFENGVDLQYFDPAAVAPNQELLSRPAVVFVGEMDYFPNADAACWFAQNGLPEVRREVPGAEFWIVGRNPNRSVQKLTHLPGVHVTGGVADVRPYLKAARAVIAPLRVARGIQNKVLEALAMGKTILASRAVCNTLDPEPPHGVICCDSISSFAASVVAELRGQPAYGREDIREQARGRFSWERNVGALLNAVEGARARQMHTAASFASR